MINWGLIIPPNESAQTEAPSKEAAQSEPAAAEAAVPQELCAQEKPVDEALYPAHPAAVLLLLAWSAAKGCAVADLADALGSLVKMRPADQVHHWHGLCQSQGIKPWRVLCIPAPTWGNDCTRCAHLQTVEDVIGADRRRYHWACTHGYLILEHGRGTERLHIAPPECQSFERFYPSSAR